MPLFDVPGWSVTAAPVLEPSTQVSKKRKRPSEDNSDKIQNTEFNLEKLVKRLKGNIGTDDRGRRNSRNSGVNTGDASRKMVRRRERKAQANEEKKNAISRPKPLKATEKTLTSPRPAKKVKVKHDVTEPSSSSDVMPTRQPEDSGLTILQKGMKHSLDGARFRLINETLYKTDSGRAHQMMQDDPKVYEEYHTGFRHQVQSWPTNPVKYYISTLAAYPPKTVVADLGCGDAAIARALIPKGFTVLSFDLVSDGTFVIEADACKKIPLPGSEGGKEGEKTYGEGHIVDVVICALSLMGTNWPNCIREAWRVLKPDGKLKIAEVASRFTDVDDFSSLVASIGFRLKSKDDRNTHFTLFEFRKIDQKGKSVKEWAKLLSKGIILKPCEYKRR